MIIETKPTQTTPADGNVFADLGFEPEEAATLQAASKKLIAGKVALKEHLMSEIAEWISENRLKQAEAAQILGVTRPRVSDVVHKKTIKFTIDALVDMLSRAGKQVQISVQ